ncbi:MAG: hypothetical protein SWX82_01680 [Cyanobacteriota bacterium]|nr:hypothetical protein [Cyanobacteriota bacterium]
MEIIENLLKFRLNSLDDELREIIQPMLLLSPEEFVPLLSGLTQILRQYAIRRGRNSAALRSANAILDMAALRKS